MRCVLIIVVAVTGILSPVRAQQPATPSAPPSSQGPDFPSSGSGRGPNFPASVSPTATNPTNWVAPQNQYTEPSGPNTRWSRWNGRLGGRGGWGR
jgi:hypothetical protein